MKNTKRTIVAADRLSESSLPRRPLALFLYNFLLYLYVLAIRVFGIINAKAAKWVAGRKNWERQYASVLQPGEKRAWFHCSSVGEFEQARPVIETLKLHYPSCKIVVTFFSPSGYEACKKNPIPDYIFYLPADTRDNASAFIDLVNPVFAAFVKYEFWYHYLYALRSKGIPALLVSGAFRSEQPFFKWYGGLFRDMLSCFSFFFLQDELSALQLNGIGIDANIVVSGDTRYDRVSAIARNIAPISAIEKFRDANNILIAGSTWPADEKVLKACLPAMPPNWKLIIAPHEIDGAHIRNIQKLFGDQAILYSDLDAENTGFGKRILIIDNIGMLSRLFAYGDIAYIGGGFYKGGIHNILEPAVFGVPVIFGPVYEKFVEAKEMASLKIVFPIKDEEECSLILKKLVDAPGYRQSVRDSLLAFMLQHTGATGAIVEIIKTKEWLD